VLEQVYDSGNMVVESNGSFGLQLVRIEDKYGLERLGADEGIVGLSDPAECR
jgi:hypothetical protein